MWSMASDLGMTNAPTPLWGNQWTFRSTNAVAVGWQHTGLWIWQFFSHDVLSQLGSIKCPSSPSKHLRKFVWSLPGMRATPIYIVDISETCCITKKSYWQNPFKMSLLINSRFLRWRIFVWRGPIIQRCVCWPRTSARKLLLLPPTTWVFVADKTLKCLINIFSKIRRTWCLIAK